LHQLCRAPDRANADSNLHGTVAADQALELNQGILILQL